MQFVLQASRAITYNLASVARHIKRDFPELGKFLCVKVSDGSVSINNPSGFHKLTQSIAAAQTASEEQQNNDARTKPKGCRAGQLFRWSHLWSPFGRRSVNVSIVRDDGSVAEATNEKADELRSVGGKLFSRRRKYVSKKPKNS